jgi:hypothetical protein
LTCDMSHIVTDIICCGGRLHYACLHINSWGRKRLMQLIAERFVGDHVSGISSIPVIKHARASPFFFF